MRIISLPLELSGLRGNHMLRRAAAAFFVGMAFCAASYAQDSGAGFGAGPGNSAGKGLYGLSVNAAFEWQFDNALASGLWFNVLMPFNEDAGPDSPFFDLNTVFQPSLFLRWNAVRTPRAAFFVQGNAGLLFPRYYNAAFAALSIPVAFDLSAMIGLRVHTESGLYVEPFLRAGGAPFYQTAYGGGGVLLGFTFSGREARSYAGSYSRQGMIKTSQAFESGDIRAIERSRPLWVRNMRHQFREDGREVFVCAETDDALMLKEGGRSLNSSREGARKQAYTAMAKFIHIDIQEESSDHFSGSESAGVFQSEQRASSRVASRAVLRNVREDDCYYEIWSKLDKKRRVPVEYVLYWGKFSIADAEIAYAQQLLSDEHERERYLARERSREQKRFEELRAASGQLDAYFSGLNTLQLSQDSPETSQFTARYYQLGELTGQLKALKIPAGEEPALFEYRALLERNGALLRDYDPARLITLPQKQRADTLASENIRLNAALSQLREDFRELSSQRDSITERYVEARENALGVAENLLVTVQDWPKPSANALREAKRYQIKEGDTLVKIARKEYGNALYFWWIYTCNDDQINSPHRIRAGKWLRLPPLPERFSPVSPLAAR